MGKYMKQNTSREQVDTGDILDIPLVLLRLVVDAFASELYLKCLATIEHVQFRKVHDHSKLFNLLSQSVQASIEKKWDGHRLIVRVRTDMAAIGGVAYDLRSTLTQSGNTFERARYHYEDPSWITHVHFGVLPRILRDIILGINPTREAT
jgi:hypothetical protein